MTPRGVLGFTGTGKLPGMKPRQLKAVRQLLYNVDALHLGDCVNADAQAHLEAIHLGIETIGHPPTNPSRRAFCTYDEEREPREYLLRNRDIVAEGVDGIIAAPSGWVEERRSGTWSTVRYAREAKRHIWIVRPDGTIKEEQP